MIGLAVEINRFASDFETGKEGSRREGGREFEQEVKILAGSAAEVIELKDPGAGFSRGLIEDGDTGGERFSAFNFFLHGGDIAAGVVGFVKGDSDQEGNEKGGEDSGGHIAPFGTRPALAFREEVCS